MTAALVASLLAAASCLAVAATVPAAIPPSAGADGRRGGPAWLARLGALGPSRARDRVAATLQQPAVGWTAAEVVGAQRLAFASLAVIVLVAPSGPLLAVPLVLVVWRGPTIAVARIARRRRSRASRELPLFLDLLAVATGAGLGPQTAVRRAVEPLGGPLAEELVRALRDADLGRRWRDELASAASRLGLPELDRAVRLLIRTERLGSSLADEMARLASDVREERRARSVERARAAPVKMLFPLVFLILPAFLLLTVVPVLLTTVASIG